MPAADLTAWGGFLEWVARYRVGDLSSMLGVLISVVGFVVTIWNVLRSKAAAVHAREAAEEARRAVGYADVLAKVPRAISGIAEVKQLHRNNVDPGLLAEKYGQLRNVLVEVRWGAEYLSHRDKEFLREAIVSLGAMEASVDRAIMEGVAIDMATNNEVLRAYEDKLVELLTAMKKQPGGSQ